MTGTATHLTDVAANADAAVRKEVKEMRTTFEKQKATLAAAEKRRRRDKSYLNRVTFLGRSIGLRATVQPGVHGYRHHATAAPTRKPSAIRDWVTSDLNRSVSFG